MNFSSDSARRARATTVSFLLGVGLVEPGSDQLAGFRDEYRHGVGGFVEGVGNSPAPSMMADSPTDFAAGTVSLSSQRRQSQLRTRP